MEGNKYKEDLKSFNYINVCDTGPTCNFVLCHVYKKIVFEDRHTTFGTGDFRFDYPQRGNVTKVPFSRNTRVDNVIVLLAVSFECSPSESWSPFYQRRYLSDGREVKR